MVGAIWIVVYFPAWPVIFLLISSNTFRAVRGDESPLLPLHEGGNPLEFIGFLNKSASLIDGEIQIGRALIDESK